MKQLLMLYFLLLAGAGIQAQQTFNDPHAMERKVGHFEGVHVSEGIVLYLSQADREQVAVSANDEQERENIRTEVRDNVLHISYKGRHKRRRVKLVAYVSIATLQSIDASSGAWVTLVGTIHTPALSIDLSSGAMVRGRLAVGKLSLDQSSGAVAELTGEAAQFKVDGSSGSICKAYDLRAQVCMADVSSGSRVQLYTEKELSAEATSGAAVLYKGDGVIRQVRASSGGKISKKS